LEAAMKAILLSALVAFVAYGVTFGYASEPRHAVIVDTPDIITMTYASPYSVAAGSDE
jgi:hypothetical protein